MYKNQEGLYKYLLTISIYLIMPIMPAILFGIISKRVTLVGALASILAGIAMTAVFITDQITQQLYSIEYAAQQFPLLHTKLSYNYMYRGLWGTLVMIVVLYAASSLTQKTAAEKLDRTTINWGSRIEPFEGWTDWRLHLGLLAIVNVAIYILIW